MPQTIARSYASHEAATHAVNELQERGFKAEAIHGRAARVPEPTPDAPETTFAAPETRSGALETTSSVPVTTAGHADTAVDPAIQEALLRAGVSREHAKIYAERIHAGETVVVVEPPFGFALAATTILDSHDPVAVDLPAEVESERTAASGGWDWRSPTPLSSWMGWRVLSDDPTPLSNYLKRPVLKPEPEASATLDGIRKSSRDAAPLSAKIGMPVLSDNPAPLSSRFGWRLLSEKAAPLSERFGWRLLSDDPTPLSSKFGWRVLSDNPTPLSSRLGLKALSKED